MSATNDNERLIPLSRTAPVSIFPINSRPYGLSYSEWSMKWWQWFLSIPKISNPAFDFVGDRANINQDQVPAFFLCQTYENTSILAKRSIKMQLNRPIFMPIINWISIQHCDGETDEELLAVANKKMNVVKDLDVKINGIPMFEELKDYRVKSPFFNIELPSGNVIGLPSGVRRAISDGFWLFLVPKGERVEIATFATCSSGSTKIAVLYSITFM